MSLFERLALWGSTVLVGASGIVYAWMKYGMTSWDPYAVVHHPWQPFVLKLHVLSAPLLVFAIGLVFTRHIWRQFRSGLPGGRRSGLTLLLTVAPMVASGYLIQTATEERWLFGLAIVHLVTSGGYLLVFLGHNVSSWVRERKAARAERSGEATR